MKNNLELRMYGLVIYQLSPIQAGIQFQHAVTRYSRVHDSETYRNWADNWQTSIVLNGGTTNLNPNKLGTINQDFEKLKEENIICEAFYEPDLGDQMTAFTFIVDERVFNKKKYPDYGLYYDENIENFEVLTDNNGYVLSKSLNHQEYYQKWVDNIGGYKNVFLRNFLNNKNLWK